jgi:outer membrane protein OmpA-like peptidoglycan-associated protein
MLKKTLIGAVAIALSCGVASAGENKLTKEEGVGMLGGAAAGALVGGPIGAFVGAMFGGIVGDGVGTVKSAELRAKTLEQELIDTRVALAKASERTGGDEMFDALAERLHADVMFRTASVDIDAGVIARLEEIGKLLSTHPQLEVQLHGFADPRGTLKENLELSQRRADAVREALMKGGAAPEQIQLSAHGEDLTTAAKGDFEAFAWERRVSLAIRPSAATSVAQSR